MTPLATHGARAAALLPAIVVACLAYAGAMPREAQMATAERLEGKGFWPTKGTAARHDYVGPEACTRCHASKAATQRTTAMARTLSAAGTSVALQRHATLTFAAGRLVFHIERRDGTADYVVREGDAAIRARLGWAFGAGKVGQTFLFEHDGLLREARVSYFGTTDAAGFTPTRALGGATSLVEAMGRVVPPQEARRCFGCHTTASTVGGQLTLETLIPGVTCEACHGPGRAHVEAMSAPQGVRPPQAMINPQTFTAADSVDFCGACHATSWDVTLAGERGIAALRSQPYRLQSSPCWGDGDSRLTCVACHDPHAPLVPDGRSYDANCLACHGSGASAGHAPESCRLAGACVSCHMPKYRVAEMHASFTDHRIQTPP